MSAKSDNSAGIGFFGLLTIVFIALKLTEVIDWSWWLILAPLYVPTLVGFLVGVLIITGAGISKR